MTNRIGSIGFGTENIVYVPAGQALRVFDLYSWRVLSLPVHQSRARLRSYYLGTLEQDVGKIRKQLADEAKDRESALAFRGSLSEFNRITRDDSGEDDALTPDLPFVFSHSMKFWVRLSNEPAESFFIEDYQESAEPIAEKLSHLQVYGSCSMSLGEEHEIPFPAEGDNAAFELGLPTDQIHINYIPVDQPLPIVDEYCGAFGVSSLGNSVNLTLTGEIAKSHQLCVPIREIETHQFQTMYMQYETTQEYRLAIPMSVERMALWEKLFQLKNYEMIHSGPTHRIWGSGGDVIHLYFGLEGKETHGVEQLPITMLIATGDGSHTPDSRHQLYQVLAAQLK